MVTDLTNQSKVTVIAAKLELRNSVDCIREDERF